VTRVREQGKAAGEQAAKDLVTVKLAVRASVIASARRFSPRAISCG
jgi:hypothetical protein